MTLVQRLSDELKAAMLAKDADRLSTLRLLKSAIGYAEIERKTDNLTDAEVITLVQREIKKRRDAIEQSVALLDLEFIPSHMRDLSAIYR
jgi:hypothetical protein